MTHARDEAAEEYFFSAEGRKAYLSSSKNYCETSFQAGAKWAIAHDPVVRGMREALVGMKSQFEWYQNTFAGWEDREHEFQHWWRVEIPFQIEEALAAYEKEVGE